MNRRTLIAGTGSIVAAGALCVGLAAAEPAAAAERFIIMPAVDRSTIQRLDDGHNCYTIVYDVMERWNLDTMSVELTPVDTPRYREWLADGTTDDGIPPHIVFGGAIVAGAGDPTFRDRWVERTRQKLDHGVLS